MNFNYLKFNLENLNHMKSCEFLRNVYCIHFLLLLKKFVQYFNKVPIINLRIVHVMISSAYGEQFNLNESNSNRFVSIRFDQLENYIFTPRKKKKRKERNKKEERAEDKASFQLNFIVIFFTLHLPFYHILFDSVSFIFF